MSKQTDALVVAVSQPREVVSLYVDGAKYVLEDIPVVLAKANQPIVPDLYLTTLELTMAPPVPRPWLLAAIGC